MYLKMGCGTVNCPDGYLVKMPVVLICLCLEFYPTNDYMVDFIFKGIF